MRDRIRWIAVIAAVALAAGPAAGNGEDDLAPLPEEQLKAMGYAIDPASVAETLEATGVADGVRVLCARALGRAGPEQGLRPLLSALQAQPSPSVRAAAAHGLGRLRDSRAVEGLAQALSDASPPVRSVAAQALSEVGGPDAARGLAARLLGSREDSAEVRMSLASSLGYVGQKQIAAPALAFALSDPSPEVRLLAGVALGRQYRDPRAYAALIGTLKAKDAPDWMAAKAMRALEDMTGQRFGWTRRSGGSGTRDDRAEAVAHWLRYWEEHHERLTAERR